MSYKPHLIAAYMSYPLTVWFIFASIIFILSKKEVPWCLIALVFYWSFYSYAIFNNSFDHFEYIESKGKLIYFDGAFSVIMSMFLKLDKSAWKHALLLCFATLCHIMIIWDLSIHSSFFSNFFYAWYDELIIMVGLLQMVISSDGITSVLRRLQRNISRLTFYRDSFSKSIHSHKASRERT